MSGATGDSAVVETMTRDNDSDFDSGDYNNDCS